MVRSSSRPRVAAALSGGTDSAVAAALLLDQGYEVIGLTARLWNNGSRCCSEEDIERAERVCWHLGIRHIVVSAYALFARCVVDRFACEYARGRTPSPCIVCNEQVKFGLLLQRAREFDCDFLATGHYARIERQGHLSRLFRARDHTRDQSYFLHRLSQFQLSRTLFPLANLLKRREVIPYAHQRGLPIPDNGKESQDLCFVPPGTYAEFVERFFPGLARPGPIVTLNGETIGVHQGLHRYTIGQRSGIGGRRARPEPLYVIRLDPPENRLWVGRREQAFSRFCMVEEVHWIAAHPPPAETPLAVRLRYRHEPAPADWEPLSDGRVAVLFEHPQFAVTPGQAAVFYSGEEVLGGGWIGPTAIPTRSPRADVEPLP